MSELQQHLGGARDGAVLRDSRGYHTDMTQNERLALLAAALELERQRDCVQYLEIGVMAGGVIRFLRERTQRLKFTGIDLFEDFEPSAANTHSSATFRQCDVQEALGPEVRLLKGDSAQVLRRLQEEAARYDMVLIDGNHAYAAVKEDLAQSLPLLTPGSFVAFHNASVHIPPDPKYVARDGGPWRLTQELRRQEAFTMEIEVERLRVFRYGAA